MQTINSCSTLAPYFVLRIIIIIMCVIVSSPMIMAQQADIEGNTKIRGKIDINHMDDTTSIIIGRNAGQNLDFAVPRSNTFVGVNAGFLNTIGRENSFFGFHAGHSHTTGIRNSFFGYHAGRSSTTGNANAFFGAFAGQSNTVGVDNAFFGEDAGSNNTTGLRNSFFGQDAGTSNTTGDNNSFFGTDAGFANVEANNNSFFGSNAGRGNIIGSSNSFFGVDAGRDNTTGSFNSFFGNSSGKGNTDGNENSMFGFWSGLSNTTGIRNTFIGVQAGFNNTTGSKNTFIGWNAGIEQAQEFDHSIAIGYDAKVACSNCAVIGGSGQFAVNLGLGANNPTNHKLYVTSNNYTGAYVKGNEFAIELGGTDSPYSGGTDDGVIRTQADQAGSDMILVSNDFITLHLNEDNDGDNSQFEIRSGSNDDILSIDQIGDLTIAGNLTENSDANLKENLVSLTSVLPQIVQLAGYRYRWKDNSQRDVQFGLIAQEVAKVFPELVKTSDTGIQSVNYTRFVPLLIESIKEQQEIIESLQTRLSKVELSINGGQK